MSERQWWTMPGPRRFIMGIVDDLRAGKNVIIHLPAHTPAGIREVVRAIMDRDGWYQLYEEGIEQPPIDVLFQAFSIESPHTDLWNIATLVHAEQFKGYTIWLEGLTPEIWPAWCAFLQEYEPICRASTSAERTIFCLVLDGVVAPQLPANDICLSVHQYLASAVVQHTDMLLFCAHMVPARETGIQYQLVLASTARLAGWDPMMALMLAEESFARINAPFAMLTEVARERGWDHHDPEHAWARGISDGGKSPQFHSAYLALDEKHHAPIRRRLWCAQVEVLFPYIDDQRQRLIGQIGYLLQAPFTLEERTIETIEDLEIGHICDQLYERNVAPTITAYKTARYLRSLRNRLAHLEHVDTEFLASLGVDSE